MEIDPKFGYILQEKVDLDFLERLEPQNFPDMIKLVINKDTVKMLNGILFQYVEL